MVEHPTPDRKVGSSILFGVKCFTLFFWSCFCGSVWNDLAYSVLGRMGNAIDLYLLYGQLSISHITSRQLRSSELERKAHFSPKLQASSRGRYLSCLARSDADPSIEELLRHDQTAPFLQAGMDVSEQLTRFGAWQPAGSAGRGPTVADALIGSLGGHGAPEKVCPGQTEKMCKGNSSDSEAYLAAHTAPQSASYDS